MNNSTVVITILLLGAIIIFTLRRKNLLDWSNKYPALQYISIGLAVIAVVVMLLFIFNVFNFNESKHDYGWHVDYIDYNSIHAYSTGKSQRIALIDSGISSFQMDSYGTSSISLKGEDHDVNGHGTMMHSILKGYGNEIIGIAPDAEIISIKAIDIDESIEPSKLVEAIEKAIKLESTIINLSLGSLIYNEQISEIIDIALEQGITVVASSGDYGIPEMLFPASKSEVISVGSISADLQVSKFTNAPNETIINAPGDEIKTILKTGDAEFTFGASQSTAIISGYVALLKDYAYQKEVNLTHEKIIDLLTSINKKENNYVSIFSEIN